MACGRKCSPVPSPSPLQSHESLPFPAWPIIADHSVHQFYVLRVVMTAIASVLGLLLILFVILRFLGRYFFWRRYYHNRRTRTNSPILFDVRGDSSFSDDNNNDDDDGPSIMHPIWFINTVGLQQSVIDSIAMFKYRKDDGLVEGTECSVCLGEFQEDETLRILPKCTHAFHVECIDTWLRSRKNCPLCRAPVIRENSLRDVTAVTVPPEGGAHVEILDGGGGSFEVGGAESSVSELRVEEVEEEDGDGDDGIVAIEDEEDCEVLDKNLGNGEKMMRVNRSVSVHSYDTSSTFEVSTQELNSYSLHSF